MSELTPEEVAKTLDQIDKKSICHIGDCAGGWWIHGGGANWFAVSCLQQRWPNLLFTGFSVERDPEGKLVQLTDFGQRVRRIIEAELQP